MAALTELGSYAANVSAGQEIIDLIYDDLDTKLKHSVSRKPLRHVTIYGITGDTFTVNEHFKFEIKNDSWSSPNNDTGTLVQIRSLKANQQCDLQVYYLR